MTGTSEIREFFKANRKRIWKCIFLFWLVFALLIFIEDEVAARIANLKHDPVDRLQYCIRWVLWTLLTPLVIFLAVKFPIRNNHITADIVKHFFLALLVISLEFIIEIPIIRYATLRINGSVEPVSEYAAVFILKLNIYLLLYFLVLGTTYLVLYIDSYNRSKMLTKQAELQNQQLQTQLSQAKLSFLKMQLDPHFLFNTHHSIISLMLSGENEKAIKMLTMLSDLLRLSLDNKQQTIPLQTEIKLVTLYLDIQKIRFDDRMKFSFNIQPGTLQQNVPSFILQPLVENAVKHGIAVSSNAGNIEISSCIKNNQLVLKVENENVGTYVADLREGIGISNTKERLRQLYNGRASFELNQIPRSVTAIISIPIN
jgi:two-component system LytT family sensor kinase